MEHTCKTQQGWGNKEELSWESGPSHNVHELGAWADPSGYTKVSQHSMTTLIQIVNNYRLINQSIDQGLNHFTELSNIVLNKLYKL